MLLCAGLGAGLRQRELVRLEGEDVGIAGGAVVLRVRSAPCRLVSTDEPYASRLVALSSGTAGGYLFRPGLLGREYKNAANDFCRHLVADPTAPLLSLARCRVSFLTDKLDSGTPLEALREMAGLKDVSSLARYAIYTSRPSSKAALRAMAANERRERRP